MMHQRKRLLELSGVEVEWKGHLKRGVLFYEKEKNCDSQQEINVDGRKVKKRREQQENIWDFRVDFWAYVKKKDEKNVRFQF